MTSVEQKQEYFDYINRILGVNFDPKQQCICITSLSQSGEIWGVVVFNRFTISGVELSVASTNPRFLNRTFLDVLFHYAFVTCKKTRITAMVEEGNGAAMRLNQGLGFIAEAKLKCWYGDKDGIILRMLKDECRWVKALNEQKIQEGKNVPCC